MKKTRKSRMVTLALCGSLAVLGVASGVGCDTRSERDRWEPAPVYVNGVMGVYHPHTNAFVPSTASNFQETTRTIRTEHFKSVDAGKTSQFKGGSNAMGGKSGIVRGGFGRSGFSSSS
jgi:hypothetical protein